MIGIIIAILSGALMSMQGVFNTGITKQTNIWVSSVFVQLTAFVVCLAGWFILGRDIGFTSLIKIDNKYMLLGGVMGAFITITVVIATGTLGPAKATMLILIAQLIISYVIELLALFGSEKAKFEVSKLIGIGIIILGIIVFTWEGKLKLGK